MAATVPYQLGQKVPATGATTGAAGSLGSLSQSATNPYGLTPYDASGMSFGPVLAGTEKSSQFGSAPPPSSLQSLVGAGQNAAGSTVATSGAASALPAPTTAGQAPQNYLEDLYKQFGSAYMAPTYTGAAMGGLQQQLSQPGQAEQFYQQAQNTATDPYYQRLQQQGMDALNQQMAARGNYNSGGAIAGLGNFASGLAAQQYSQMGQLANQAQSQGQSRAGLMGSLSNSADANDLSHLNGLFGQAGNAQQMNQNGINSMLGQQMGIDSTGAGLAGQFYGAGGQFSGSAAQGGLEAQVKAQLARSGADQATQDMIMKGLGFLAAVA